MADAVANVRDALQETSHGSCAVRLVVMSAFGVADSFENLNWLLKTLVRRSNMSIQFDDHAAVERETKASGMCCVFVRPVMLKGEASLPVKVLGDTGKQAGLMSSISRASVARFLVDAAESGEWDGRTPVVCN